MSDVLDILEVSRPSIAADSHIDRLATPSGASTNTKKRASTKSTRKPDGISRELYNLLCGDGQDPAPLLQADSSAGGYKQNRASFGVRRVRPWQWAPFVNPARMDTLRLNHWQRVGDEQREYPFAKFNRCADVPKFTDSEYQQHLQADSWSRAETEHLMTLCSRFDLRFAVIHDRWDRQSYSRRSIEQLKERFYNICSILGRIRGAGEVSHLLANFVFDAAHETRRKQQLVQLYSRTPEQVEEEQQLMAELRKIEARKRERERKTQDLQKLINSGDAEQRKLLKKAKKKGSMTPGVKTSKDAALGSAGSGGGSSKLLGDNTLAALKTSETRTAGVTLRSQKLKIPTAVGQKKAKALEQLIVELGVEVSPMATAEITSMFAELKSDLLLLYELKTALSGCELELQSLQHEYDALLPNGSLEIPRELTAAGSLQASASLTPSSAERPRSISEMIDIHGNQNTPMRKRKAALEQSRILTKIRSRS